MSTIRTLLLILASIIFIVVVGGATYEHSTMVPRWASAVPASLAMFQGEYAPVPFRFWVPIHPIAVALLVAALSVNWKTERRNFILLALGGYLVALGATFLFFVPELLAITQSTYSPAIDPALTRRAQLWQALSLVRLGWMVLVAVILLLGLSKSGESKAAPG
jgi:hypothetical protein